jgi:hypothetical protein
VEGIGFGATGPKPGIESGVSLYSDLYNTSEGTVVRNPLYPSWPSPCAFMTWSATVSADRGMELNNRGGGVRALVRAARAVCGAGSAVLASTFSLCIAPIGRRAARSTSSAPLAGTRALAFSARSWSPTIAIPANLVLMSVQSSAPGAPVASAEASCGCLRMVKRWERVKLKMREGFVCYFNERPIGKIGLRKSKKSSAPKKVMLRCGW